MKKKKNPNKQPVSYRSVDVKRITENAISTMTVVSWTCIIGGLLDFPEINSQTIIQLWDDVNLFSRRVGNESGRPLSEAKMREAEQKSDCSLLRHLIREIFVRKAIFSGLFVELTIKRYVQALSLSLSR